MMVYDLCMTTVRVRGIGTARTPIAEKLYEFLVLGKVTSGDEIRRFFKREKISTWEGSKVLGHFRTSGVVDVLDEATGGGPVTWRRTYVRVADWDNTPAPSWGPGEIVDAGPYVERADGNVGKWVRLPDDMVWKQVKDLRDAGYEVGVFVRAVEGEKLRD